MEGKKTLGIVLALALFAFWAGQGLMDTPAWAAEKTFTLKIGSGHSTAAKWIEYMAKFYIPKVVKRVKAETKYELVFSEQWGGSVAKLGEVLEATEIGLLDIGADIIVFHGQAFQEVPHIWGNSQEVQFTVAQRRQRRGLLRSDSQFPLS
jgi:TRAP-type C4-dicarboxylate transport system substrate-binding protein